MEFVAAGWCTGNREVVETLPNYKKSYFWWYWNPACGYSAWGNWTEKDQSRVSARLV